MPLLRIDKGLSKRERERKTNGKDHIEVELMKHGKWLHVEPQEKRSAGISQVVSLASQETVVSLLTLLGEAADLGSEDE